MKLLSTIMIATLTCANFVQVVVAEKIKIAKQNPLSYKSPWSYRLITKKTQDSEPVESEPTKFNKKNAIITFDAKDDEVLVQVVTPTSVNRIVLKRGNQAYYKNKGILVNIDGKVSLIDKNDAPFAPTHKVAVEKENSDGKKWLITSNNPDPEKRGLEYFEYGEIKITNSTNVGRGLAVPKNKAFTIGVQKTPGSDWIETNFTQQEANRLKKIRIDEHGKARAA